MPENDAHKDQIGYERLMQDAYRHLIRSVMTEAAENGLPGEHHFYIVFRTSYPGVWISDRLRSQYPHEMTIVLQHQFRNLEVSEKGFKVELSFGGIPEILNIPFRAISGFVDPSVPFGLQLEGPEESHQDQASSGNQSGGAINLMTARRQLSPGRHEEPHEHEGYRDELSDEELERELRIEAERFHSGRPHLREVDLSASGDNAPRTSAPGGEAENPQNSPDQPQEKQSAKIVSLDAFRKKS